MREWADVHRQTSDILRHMKGFRERSVPASYEALHRSIVAGLIGNVATKEDDGSYRATRNRQVWLFPGSVLFSKRPPWVVCHDIVETSRVYARTLAAIDPAWLESLAPHLLRRHYAEPHFDPETGFVRAFETVTLFGLPIVKGRKADYGTIAPAEANELFIREGLVEERLRCRHRFFRKNRSVRQRVAELEAKLRTRGLSGGDEAVCAFYKPRLEGIRSIHELNRLIRSRGGDGFLLMAEKDLLVDEVPDEASRFPESVTVGGKNFALRYAFEPAAEHDGVTLSIPEEDAAHLDCDSVGWIIRPLWPEKIRHLLTQLPKNMRRRLMPLGSTARELARILQPGPGPFTAALTELIRTKHGIPVHNDLFREHDLPRHLRLRVEIRDARGEVIRSGRGAEAVAADASADGSGKKRPEEWKRKTASHERRGMQSWEIDSVPEMIEVGTAGAGVPLYGYPALCPGDNGVDVIVFTTREHADANHVRGVETLLEMVLAHELAWLARDLRLPQEIKVLCAPFGGHEQMAHRLEAMIRRSAISPGLAVPRTRASFEKLVEERERQLRYAGSRAAEILKQILTSAPHIRRTVDKHSLQGKSTAYSDIRKELLAQLDGYINILRCERVSWRVYEQLPRYLRALDIRARRAFEDPPRYRQRMNTYLSFCTESNELRDLAAACPRGVWLMEEMEMMLEEYLISLFAQQEMKTLFPVSEKRLRKKVTALREAMTGSR
jgi:ATP-dependent helicase HrpA